MSFKYRVRRRKGFKKQKDGLASKLETRMLAEIKEKMPESFRLEYETKRLPYILKKNYLPDFIITKPDGSIIYIEVKGYFSSTDRVKLLAVKDLHPCLDLRIVFDKDNKLSSKSDTRYSEWCDRNKIRYSVGKIPQEWFNDGSQVRKKGLERNSKSNNTKGRSGDNSSRVSKGRSNTHRKNVEILFGKDSEDRF